MSVTLPPIPPVPAATADWQTWDIYLRIVALHSAAENSQAATAAQNARAVAEAAVAQAAQAQAAAQMAMVEAINRPPAKVLPTVGEIACAILGDQAPALQPALVVDRAKAIAENFKNKFPTEAQS